MVAARFSPAPSGMIVGISAVAHEIERHDRSTCDIDLVVWCLVGGEMGHDVILAGKSSLWFSLSLAAAARLLLACLASLAAAFVLSPSAPAHALALASRTWPDIPPLAPVVCISHSSNPPLLVPLVRCCELDVAAPSLSLAFALVWIDYTSPLRDRHLACWSVCSRHLVDLLLVRISSYDSERVLLVTFVRHGKRGKAQKQGCAWCVTLRYFLVTRAALLGQCECSA